ncbi:hypothetical protein A0H81_11598 [Grifola frondosa]|uniref:DRBM domain-containing protein n=1 Tax=Grifola frondosa TaxID=5627 RepID=A0A1C7LWK8_GRIFR|nr:hypothetical protein A0H81_11598 [Grifola frondosa]
MISVIPSAVLIGTELVSSRAGPSPLFIAGLSQDLRILYKIANTNNTHILSWEESRIGPDHAGQWKMSCKVNGEVKGVAVSSQKGVAKEDAAKQALQALGAI